MRWAALGWVLGLVAAAPAMAQQMTLEPSAAVQCLTPAAAVRGKPEYPMVDNMLAKPGHVVVALKFTTPTTRPEVKVLAQEGGDSFVDAVKQHVRDYRVPCHDGGERPVSLVFTFDFRPRERLVLWSTPVEEDQAAREAQLACISHVSGDKSPAYPPQALRAGVQGRVLVRLRYEAPDRPPVAEVLPRADANSSYRSQTHADLLSGHLKDWVAGLRMPCHQGKPITIVNTYFYRFEGEAVGFKPGLELVDLLPLVRGIRRQTLDFDFNGMGCPFDITLQYRQPHMLNRVGEIGSFDPARRPFLDWLARIDLDLPERVLDSVYGDSLSFTVPCLKINLQPEKPS